MTTRARGSARGRRNGPAGTNPASDAFATHERAVEVVTATAGDEAEAAVADAYLPNRIETLEPGTLAMSLATVRLGSTTVGQLGYGRRLRLVTEEARHIHVNTPVVGTVASRVGRSAPLTTSRMQAAVFPVGEPADIEWSRDAVQLCLMIPSSTLESELEELLGHAVRRPLDLPFQMSLLTPEGRVWRSMVDLIAGQLAGGGRLLSHPSAGPQLERTLLDAFLLGHAYDNVRGPRPSDVPAVPVTVTRAVDLLHERPAEAWSSTVLARAAHVSVRSLQAGFVKHVGKPPMAYLRDLRLAGIHEELQRSTPGTTTVEAIAYRWGMLHLGRFAAAYRQSFGELPSQTLKRQPS